MGAFDAVRREHAAMSAEAYNDDHVYKQKLNQVRASEQGMCTEFQGRSVQ